jgi:transposase
MSNLSIACYFQNMKVKVVKQNVHGKGPKSTCIMLEPDRRYTPTCHACGNQSKNTHSKDHRRLIRDMDIAGAEVWLQVNYRKIWCSDCLQARVEKLEFCDASKRVTHRMSRYIHELCKMMTVTDVARHLAMDPKTVKQIDKAFLEEAYGQNDFDHLTVIMIDEIAIRKGHSYMTVIADYFTGRVLWMGSNRDKETLDDFFEGLTASQKATIKAVAMDMWKPFINRVAHHCPDAKIVFDFFHVTNSFGKVIDKVRRQEFQKADEEGKGMLKGTRYLLLKNAANLTDNQRIKLESLLSENETLTSLYLLKDQLKLVFYYDDREKCKEALDSWCEMASCIDNQRVQDFIKFLRRHEDGLLNHADYPIDTGRLEGINNKIKVIKRKAYGFHDTRYFMLKVKQASAA